MPACQDGEESWILCVLMQWTWRKFVFWSTSKSSEWFSYPINGHFTLRCFKTFIIGEGFLMWTSWFLDLTTNWAGSLQVQGSPSLLSECSGNSVGSFQPESKRFLLFIMLPLLLHRIKMGGIPVILMQSSQGDVVFWHCQTSGTLSLQALSDFLS